MVHQRDLSSVQMLILAAADRGSTAFSHILPAIDADSVEAALVPVIARDGFLLSDTSDSYPPIATA